MREMIDKWTPKIKSLLHKLFWILVAIFLFSLVCQDFDRHDGGYIRPAVAYIIEVGMSCYADAVETANTPLASLTIAKIILFIFYCFGALFVATCVFGLWFLIKSLFEEDEEKSSYDY